MFFGLFNQKLSNGADNRIFVKNEFVDFQTFSLIDCAFMTKERLIFAVNVYDVVTMDRTLESLVFDGCSCIYDHFFQLIGEFGLLIADQACDFGVSSSVNLLVLRIAVSADQVIAWQIDRDFSIVGKVEFDVALVAGVGGVHLIV